MSESRTPADASSHMQAAQEPLHRPSRNRRGLYHRPRLSSETARENCFRAGQGHGAGGLSAQNGRGVSKMTRDQTSAVPQHVRQAIARREAMDAPSSVKQSDRASPFVCIPTVTWDTPGSVPSMDVCALAPPDPQPVLEKRNCTLNSPRKRDPCKEERTDLCLRLQLGLVSEAFGALLLRRMQVLTSLPGTKWLELREEYCRRRLEANSCQKCTYQEPQHAQALHALQHKPPNYRRQRDSKAGTHHALNLTLPKP